MLTAVNLHKTYRKDAILTPVLRGLDLEVLPGEFLSIVGMSGSGYAIGLAIASYEWMAAATLLIVGKFFLPIFLKNHIYTMPQFLERRYGGLIRTLQEKPFHAILISNEVGMGVVPESALGRSFRDLSGRAHQMLSARADEIYFGAMGSLIRLKPAPITLAIPEEGGP